MEVTELVTTSRIVRLRTLQCLLFVIVLYSLYAVYNTGNAPRIIKVDKGLAGNATVVFADGNYQIKNETIFSFSFSKPETNESVKADTKNSFNVIIAFTKAEFYGSLQKKFTTAVTSLFKFSSITINLYILGDFASYKIAKSILRVATASQKYKVMHLDISSLTKQEHETISEMKKYFSKPDTYYSDSLFFMSLVIHKLLPNIHRVIMLDCDLKFNTDIKRLFERFNLFHNTNAIGISREGHPTYRHKFQMLLNKSKDTRVGNLSRDRLTGFNSGVLLLDLDRLRKSEVYNSALNASSLKQMTEKYMFQGNLGDQDFFTLLFLEHEDLFHILPCSWNRQLCNLWRDRGYDEMVDQLFSCDGHINIYHGNCNTSIPKLEWES